MKRRIFTLLILTLIVFLLAFSLSACNKKNSSEGLFYTLINNDEEYEVANVGDCTATKIVIPSTYNGKPVTSIGEKAFYNCNFLKEIEIPNTIENIGVYAFYASNLESVIIPGSVINIGESAFSRASLKSVLILEGVKNIGRRSFSFCDSLEYVSIPNSVLSIDSDAFYYCHSLTYNEKDDIYYLGNSDNKYLYLVRGQNTMVIASIDVNCKILGNNCFHGYQYLETVEIPEGVISIGPNAFMDCSSLKKVVIPNSVTEIARATFSSCRNLTNVVMGEQIERICAEAFKSCSGLREIVIPKSATNIGDSAFEGCPSLISVDIPDNVTSIGAYAFSGASNLVSVEIGVSVTNIGEKAFENCPKIVEVCNKSNLNIIAGNKYYYDLGYRALNVCKREDERKLSIDTNGYIVYEDGEDKIFVGYVGSDTDIIIPKGTTKIHREALRGNRTITSVEIPNSVKSMGEGAFPDCSSLTKVNYLGTIDDWVQIDFENGSANPTCSAKGLYINDALITEAKITSARKISDNAFCYYDALTSVTIGDSVKSIGKYAFNSCSNLTSVKIGNGVESIKQYAFQFCSSLMEIEIGTRLKRVDYYAFSDCGKLSKVNYLGTIDSWVEINFSSYNSNPTYFAKNLYVNNELVKEVELNTNISNYAFINCVMLTSVYIGNNVESIGNYSFNACTSLTEVTIADSVTSIGDYAFSYCSYLKEISIPDGIVSIGTDVFSNCNLLKYTTNAGLKYLGNDTNKYLYLVGSQYNTIENANIENGCKIIASSAFLGCYLLERVVIPDSVISMGAHVFDKCESLANVEIPSGVTRIDYSSFYNCKSLISVEIPDSVKSIDNYAFNGCKALKSIVIPEGVTSIGESAFSGCSSLSSIVLPNSLMSIGDEAFEGCKELQYNEKDGLEYLGNSTNKYLYLAGATGKEIITSIDSNCRFIGDKAFDNGLAYSIVIPDSVISIGKGAFAGRGSLESITIGSGIKSIGDSAFDGCRSLENIVLTNGITRIGQSTFRDCSSLKSVVIPDSVKSIDYFAFKNCSSLECIKYFGSPSQWLDIVKEYNWNEETGFYTITYNYTEE